MAKVVKNQYRSFLKETKKSMEKKDKNFEAEMNEKVRKEKTREKASTEKRQTRDRRTIFFFAVVALILRQVFLSANQISESKNASANQSAESGEKF